MLQTRKDKSSKSNSHLALWLLIVFEMRMEIIVSAFG